MEVEVDGAVEGLAEREGRANNDNYNSSMFQTKVCF